MTDQDLAARWDADHRLAAVVALGAGVLVIVGTALMFTVGVGPMGEVVQGRPAAPFAITLVTGLLLLVDVALLVFVLGLAHALTEGASFGLTVTTAVATMATSASATVHLVAGYVVSSPEGSTAGLVTFSGWLSANLWLLPLFGLLVGATLVALGLTLRTGPSRFGRRLGTASAVVGGVLIAVAPFTGAAPNEPAIAAVVAIFVATVGISALLAVALVRVGMLLARSRHVERVHAS